MVRRRKPGERRIESLLGAAEQVIAEAGYDKATTNEIAKRAGASPGTFYQFFPNKEAIALALASRYCDELSQVHAEALDPRLAHSPLPVLIDGVIQAHVAFHHRRPAFHAILTAASVSPDLREALHERAAHLVARLFMTRRPRMSKERLLRVSEITVLAFGGVMPLLRTSNRKRRAAVIQELKALLHRYLEPVIGSES
jgi:AcrR family transcriptional regulator